MGVALIISVAILVEALVEYGKSIMDMFEERDYKTAITQLITIIAGILLAFSFKIDIFSTIGIDVSPVIGTVLTGVIISRGSNYASDLISKLSPKKVE